MNYKQYLDKNGVLDFIPGENLFSEPDYKVRKGKISLVEKLVGVEVIGSVGHGRIESVNETYGDVFVRFDYLGQTEFYGISLGNSQELQLLNLPDSD